MYNYHELLFYFPYEYKELQKHFCDMARKGWKLNSMKGTSLWNYIGYVRCEPQEINYYVDFVEDNNSMLWGYNNEKTQKYRSFAEEYGYTYLTGNKELLVFICDGNEPVELRDESEETRIALRKATKKNIVAYLITCVYLLLVLFMHPISNALTGFQLSSYDASSNATIFTYIARTILMTPILIMLFPAIRWMFTGKAKSRLWAMKLIVYCVLFGLALMIASIFVNENVSGLIFLSGILLIAMIAHELWWKLSSKRTKFLCGILLVGAVCVNFYSLKVTQITPIDTQLPFDSHYLGYERNTKPEITYDSSILMSKISVYYDKGENEYPDLYEVMIVKDTFMKTYLLDHLPYEHRDSVSISKQGEYTIYDREDTIVIRKDQTLLFLDSEVYHKLNDAQLKTIFVEIKNYAKDNL